MRELRSCDFCGGDALGVFEAVPDELSPTETEQRRVVLCRDCRGTLETVLEPLLARLGAERTDRVERTDVSDADNEVAGDAGDATTPPTATVDADARAEGITVGRAETTESDDGERQRFSVGDEPDEFRKVMRLLTNREFPVERDEFATLAASAYDLEDDHVARIVDYAVERGVLVDDEGTLKRA